MEAKFQVFQSPKDYQYYFRLLSKGNNENILYSEGYTTKQNCELGIASVKRNAPYDSRYERKNGFQNYTFNLLAENGQMIGRSENYQTESGRENGISSVKREAPDAPTEDLTKK